MALKDGYIPHKDDLFLIHGPGGVGKSSLISMFLGKQRDLARVSTAVAEESIHVCPVRDVSTSTFTDQWEVVDIDRQARMVAHTSHHLLTSEGVEITTMAALEAGNDDATETQPFLAKPAPGVPSLPASGDTQNPVPDDKDSSSVAATPLHQVTKVSRKTIFSRFWKPLRFRQKKGEKQPQAPMPTHEESISSDTALSLTHEESISSDTALSLTHEENISDTALSLTHEENISSDTALSLTHEENISSDTLVKALGKDLDNITGVIDKIKKELYKFMHESAEKMELFLYHSIRVVDSGGQPQFHEVVSIILRAVTGIVSVFKLSESLDVHGEVVFYKDGVQGNDPYKSYLTNEQVIRHDLLAIQSVASHSGTEEIPSLAFVGTFLDQQHACPEETPDQKDERLHSMITDILPEELQQCVISNGESLRQVMFRVNTRAPSDEDYEMAGRLKKALMSLSQVKPKNLPLKWCTYEVALRKLMATLERQVLSRQECEFLGQKLEFDSPSLKACLHYLRKFHIISFYNDLPNIVFGSCQVILDKITELVTYSLELKKGNRALVGAERKFHQQGILSKRILKSEACSKHYRKELFTTDDLLKILKSLFIITEVGEKEYLMPCVLEVSDIFPSAPTRKGYTQSSFVLHFSKKSPMLGIYCCTISYLLTEAGWKLLKKGGEVIQVSRNSVMFELPRKFSGKITFLDALSSYLEVVVELTESDSREYSAVLYHEIRDTFITAVKQAMQTLNYEVQTPELSFLCPEQSSRCSIFPHLATVNESHKYLTCSRNPGTVCHPLTPDQKMWLLKGKVVSEMLDSMAFSQIYIF